MGPLKDISKLLALSFGSCLENVKVKGVRVDSPDQRPLTWSTLVMMLAYAIECPGQVGKPKKSLHLRCIFDSNLYTFWATIAGPIVTPRVYILDETRFLGVTGNPKSTLWSITP
ncbi:hypothetical protein HAX54_004524 [Datura stramonium]|uniref:Uncharacterized protein n=1 Tax=Datura stramonium TaxID=4076 RepID=A0ABS8RU27_DATST|nr:hypothetical protein [Datura stramonium]